MKLFLIAGFLGSGKTTLLLALARYLADERGRRVCIIVNEIGEVGIDQQVMADAGLEVWELTAGCICCQLTADLVTTLNEVTTRYHPDVVLVEASGVATPSGILDALRYYKGEPFAVLETLVLVDPTRIEALLAVMSPLITGQIAAADRLVITKGDMATAAELATARAAAGEYNQLAPVLLISAWDSGALAPLLDVVGSVR